MHILEITTEKEYYVLKGESRNNRPSLCFQNQSREKKEGSEVIKSTTWLHLLYGADKSNCFIFHFILRQYGLSWVSKCTPRLSFFLFSRVISRWYIRDCGIFYLSFLSCPLFSFPYGNILFLYPLSPCGTLFYLMLVTENSWTQISPQCATLYSFTLLRIYSPPWARRVCY